MYTYNATYVYMYMITEGVVTFSYHIDENLFHQITKVAGLGEILVKQKSSTTIIIIVLLRALQF